MGGFGERTTGDRRSLAPTLLRERYPAGAKADSILPSDPPETIRGHALNTSLASASRPPPDADGDEETQRTLNGPHANP